MTLAVIYIILGVERRKRDCGNVLEKEGVWPIRLLLRCPAAAQILMTSYS